MATAGPQLALRLPVHSTCVRSPTIETKDSPPGSSARVAETWRVGWLAGGQHVNLHLSHILGHPGPRGEEGEGVGPALLQPLHHQQARSRPNLHERLTNTLGRQL